MGSLGYECVFQDRSKSMFTIANATFFRSSKLEMTWSEDRSRALLTSFRLTGADSEKELVFVANCHLEGHPYKPHERLNQAKSVLNRISLRQQSLNIPPERAHVAVVGDLNGTKQDGVYRFLYRGRLEGGWTERYLPDKVLTEQTISHPFVLRDVYADCAAFGLPFTRAVPGNACTIDYVFVSKAASVHGVLQSVSAGKAAKLARVGLPNSQYPSDHIPLGVVLEVADSPVRES